MSYAKSRGRIFRALLVPVLSACSATEELAMDQEAPFSTEHVVVYRESGRYAGWPANHGIWAWGDEILFGFSAGHHLLTDPERHPVDRDRPEEHVLARSRDGGRSWVIEKPRSLIPPPEPGHMAGVPTEPDGRPLSELERDADLIDPDTIFTFRMADIHVGPSWFFLSRDRGHQWEGPFRLPDFGQPGVAARTDYLISGPSEMLAFLTAAKSNRREGRPFMVRTRDGATGWEFVSWIGPEPQGFSIMPSTVRLNGATLVTAVRRREEHKRWIETWHSDDGGRSWKPQGPAVPDTGRGNPPSLLRLADGRLVLTYGYRGEPYGIRARISPDEGWTWSEDLVLRDDGADWDLGYTRSVQRSDGIVVTVYYFNDRSAPERYIAATLWHPDRAAEAAVAR